MTDAQTTYPTSTGPKVDTSTSTTAPEPDDAGDTFKVGDAVSADEGRRLGYVTAVHEATDDAPERYTVHYLADGGAPVTADQLAAR